MPPLPDWFSQQGSLITRALYDASYTGWKYRNASSSDCIYADAYRCLHATVSLYLAETIRPVSSCISRRHLRSADTPALLFPSTRRSTTGDWSFPASAAGRV